jgi:hypothetical protein
MKHIKEYNSYQDIDAICKEYKINNYTINNGLVDVDASVNLSYTRLTKLPLQFGKVTGSFYCLNTQLITLEGAPKEIGGGFNCDNNQLITLEGAPKWVGGGFYCYHNQLITLEGAPKWVGGDFYCNRNQLITLEGAPKEIGGYFSCNNNQLKTLEGAPKTVEGNFNCDGNPLPQGIYTYKGYIKEIIKWQDEYNIWRNGKLDEFRFNELIKDIENEIH